MNATSRTLAITRTSLPNGRALYEDPDGVFRRGNRAGLSKIASQSKPVASTMGLKEKLHALLDSSPRIGEPGAGLCGWVSETAFRITDKSRFANDTM